MTGLLEVSNGGERLRRAIGAVEEKGLALVSALRKALPFVAKQGGELQFQGVDSLPYKTVQVDLEGPVFVLPFAIGPVESCGFIVLDGVAVSLLVDGMLGGGGTAPPALPGGRLSSAQMALMNRVSSGVLAAYVDVILKPIGLTGARSEDEMEDQVGTAIRAEAHIKMGEASGRVLFIISTAVAQLMKPQETKDDDRSPDMEVQALLDEVEIEVCAELGRTRMSLRDVNALELGSTIVVDTVAGGMVAVRVAGKLLCEGQPAQQEGRIVIHVHR